MGRDQLAETSYNSPKAQVAVVTTVKLLMFCMPRAPLRPLRRHQERFLDKAMLANTKIPDTPRPFFISRPISHPVGTPQHLPAPSNPLPISQRYPLIYTYISHPPPSSLPIPIPVHLHLHLHLHLLSPAPKHPTTRLLNPPLPLFPSVSPSLKPSSKQIPQRS